MADVSIMIEGQMGLTWRRWRRIVEVVEEGGFAGLFRSDHFTSPAPPDQESLETMVSLAYAADHTQRIHLGPMVAPVTFRDPVMLARQAVAINELAGGRLILGVGAGWQQREHEMFGYPLGDATTRLARLEEGLEVITGLVRSTEPVTFEGRFFRLREARLNHSFEPQPRLRILVGGNGPKRTLPLAARYADVWNGLGLSPEEFRERNELLDELLRREGRKPADVRRTHMTSVTFARDSRELDALLERRRDAVGELSGRSLGEVFDAIRARHQVVGTADQIAQQIAEYEAAGAQEIVLQWFELDALERLSAFGEAVRSGVGTA